MGLAHAASIYMLPAHTCKLHRILLYETTIPIDQYIHIEIQQHLLVRRLVSYHDTVDQNADHDVIGQQ